MPACLLLSKTIINLHGQRKRTEVLDPFLAEDLISYNRQRTNKKARLIESKDEI